MPTPTAPCPFCKASGDAVVRAARYGAFWRTACRACTAMGPQALTYEESIESWNSWTNTDKDPMATIIVKERDIVVVTHKYYQQFPIINTPPTVLLNNAIQWAMERAENIEIKKEVWKSPGWATKQGL